MNAGHVEKVRFEVLFSGRVQGVGFRYRTESLARGFDVAGWVRNLPDGRVELVAQGPSGEVRGLLDAVEREMAGYVRERQVNEVPPSSSLSGFGVRF